MKHPFDQGTVGWVVQVNCIQAATQGKLI